MGSLIVCQDALLEALVFICYDQTINLPELEKQALLEELEKQIRRVWKTGEHMVNEEEFVEYMTNIFQSYLSSRDKKLIELLQVELGRIAVLIDKYDYDLDRGIKAGLDKAISLIQASGEEKE